LKNFLKNQFRLRIHPNCPKLSIALRNPIHQVIVVSRTEDSQKNQKTKTFPLQKTGVEIDQVTDKDYLFCFIENFMEYRQPDWNEMKR